jgi:hypothetical protein
MLPTLLSEEIAASRKPNSVSLLPACAGRRDDDHSSSPAIAGGVKQPTRRPRTGRPQAPPYLVLLRAGFCLPPTLRPARCALTAPFHPYPPSLAGPLRFSGALRRAVCFLCHFPSGCPDRALPGALPCGVRTFLSLWPQDATRGSGRLARCDGVDCTSTVHRLHGAATSLRLARSTGGSENGQRARSRAVV